MHKITESEIEEFSIELLEGLNYQYIYGLDGDTSEKIVE
jgi:hypothetical protein